MSRFLIFLVVGGAIVLVVTGVVQVQFDSDKLPKTPEVVTEVMDSRGDVLERPRIYTVRLKRVVEMFLVDNESERIDVALDHVEADAERLLELVEKAENATSLVPQTELLIASLERAKKQSRDVSPEVLVNVKDRSETVFTTAYSAFVAVDQKVATLEGDTERLATAVDSLQQEVGGLIPVESAVAGTQDENTEEGVSGESQAEPTPAETIPLEF